MKLLSAESAPIDTIACKGTKISEIVGKKIA
jgi:hypothetical protein